MKFISFNINGLRARPHQLEAIVEKYQPDVIGLQEIKVADEMFPYELVDNLGYHIFHHGQKGHYGVAFLTKQEPKAVRRGFPGDGEDAQKRIIMVDLETDFGLLTAINGYFPQGESRQHETKFPAKEKFYADLQRYIEQDHDSENPILIMGDMNISPSDLDIGIGEENRKRWLRTGKCSFLPEERQWYQRWIFVRWKNRQITHQSGQSLNRKAAWIWQIGRIIVQPLTVWRQFLRPILRILKNTIIKG